MDDSRRRMKGHPIIGTAVALLVVPPALDLALSGPRRLFAYTAADAFYYLRVADVWSNTFLLSFDGERPTNGFQPLWQLLLAGVARSSDALDLPDTTLIGFSVVFGLALLAFAVILLGRTLERAHGHLSPWFSLLPVGLYALTLLPPWLFFGSEVARANPSEGEMPLYGTLWSYANGMETSLVILCFAGLVHVALRHGFSSGRGTAALATAGALLVMARLDAALLLQGWILTLLVLAGLRRDRRLALHTLVLAAGMAFAVGAYVLWSHAHAGSYLPVSGSMKTTFPHPTFDNLRDFWRLVTLEDESFARERLYRQWPMFVPALVAIVYLARGLHGRRRRQAAGAEDLDAPSKRYRVALSATASGVLIASTYHVFFVGIWNQGHWYFPVSTLFVSLAALDLLARGRQRPGSKRRSLGIVALSSIIAVTVFLSVGHPADYHRRFAEFYFDEAPRVRSFYAATSPKLFAWDDGIDAFALQFPAMSGTGLMLDSEAFAAWRDGRLLAVAVERGYDRFSSVQYFDASGLTEASTAAEIRRRLRVLLPAENLDAYEFTVEYRAPPGRLSTPRRGSTGEYVIIRFRAT